MSTVVFYSFALALIVTTIARLIHNGRELEKLKRQHLTEALADIDQRLMRITMDIEYLRNFADTKEPMSELERRVYELEGTAFRPNDPL